MSNGTDKAFELYKLEYEKGAERYENIYKAVWANFSYLTVVSGGIYAFGSRLFPLELTAVLAVVPLVFWWLAIFEPMNRYGDEVENRLSEVERILNTLYREELTAHSLGSPPADLPNAENYGLSHYTQFADRRGTSNQSGSATSESGIARVARGLFRHPRTRYWVRVFIIGLSSVVVLFAAGVIRLTSFSKGDTVIIDRPLKPLEGRVMGVDVQDLEEKSKDDPKIKQDLDKFKESLKTVSDDVKALKPK